MTNHKLARCPLARCPAKLTAIHHHHHHHYSACTMSVRSSACYQ